MSWIPEDLVKGEPVPWYAFDAIRNTAENLRKELDHATEMRETFRKVQHTLAAQRDEVQQRVNGLAEALTNCEATLAQSAQDLVTYKDYYGTSVAQVKHLAECTECCPFHCPGDDGSHDRCYDYPTE